MNPPLRVLAIACILKVINRRRGLPCLYVIIDCDWWRNDQTVVFPRGFERGQ